MLFVLRTCLLAYGRSKLFIMLMPYDSSEGEWSLYLGHQVHRLVRYYFSESSGKGLPKRGQTSQLRTVHLYTPCGEWPSKEDSFSTECPKDCPKHDLCLEVSLHIKPYVTVEDIICRSYQDDQFYRKLRSISTHQIRRSTHTNGSTVITCYTSTHPDYKYLSK